MVFLQILFFFLGGGAVLRTIESEKFDKILIGVCG